MVSNRFCNCWLHSVLQKADAVDVSSSWFSDCTSDLTNTIRQWTSKKRLHTMTNSKPYVEFLEIFNSSGSSSCPWKVCCVTVHACWMILLGYWLEREILQITISVYEVIGSIQINIRLLVSSYYRIRTRFRSKVLLGILAIQNKTDDSKMWSIFLSIRLIIFLLTQ
jgi:hypothetical protein